MLQELDESVGNLLVHQVRVEGLELFSQIGGDTGWQGRLGSRLAINALPVLKTIRLVWECLGLEAVATMLSPLRTNGSLRLVLTEGRVPLRHQKSPATNL